MPNDLTLLIEAAKEAGKIASGFFKASPEIWDKPDGAGPVTEADLAVDNMLRESLRAARPDYGWLSEETEDDKARLTADKVFIIDPIDGTRAFIEGSKTWAHSLAIAAHGQVTNAVVYLPERDLMFTAEKGKGAYLNGDKITASHVTELAKATLLAAKPAFDPWHWQDGKVPDINRHFRSSLAYRMAAVAQGRFDAMLTLRPTWEWDIAAGALIVSEAGGRATDRRLAPLKFNNPGAQVDGVFAAGRAVHKALGARLSTT